MQSKCLKLLAGSFSLLKQVFRSCCMYLEVDLYYLFIYLLSNVFAHIY